MYELYVPKPPAYGYEVDYYFFKRQLYVTDICSSVIFFGWGCLRMRLELRERGEEEEEEKRENRSLL